MKWAKTMAFAFLLFSTSAAFAQQACEDFVYYLADHSADDGISDIYIVTLTGGNAELTYIATSDIEVHIAYNSMDNQIYAVSKHENSYRTLNPISGNFGPTVDLGGDYGELTAAVFNADGKLLIGSQNNNMIYSLSLGSGVVSTYDSYSPVTGGDLAFASDGTLYLATRSGSGLYINNPDDVMADQLIGSVPSNVTGMAITDSDQLLISSRDQTALVIRDMDGSNPGVTYPVILNGEPFTLGDGDMASGCNTGFLEEGDCDNFTTFYVNHGPGIDGSDLYTVSFTTAGLAMLNHLTNVPYEAHIAFDAANGLVYFVNADGSSVETYDYIADSFTGDLTLIGGNLSKVTATFYNWADGKLYIGDNYTNEISTVDLSDGTVTYFADGPLSGGDIAILDNGSIFLASRNQQSSLYEVVPGGDAVFVSSLAPYVTGLASANDVTSLVLSNKGMTTFTKVNSADGSIINTYTASLNGSVFSLGDGDMASGCADDGFNPSIEGCFGSEILEFEQGLQTNGNPVASNRSDATKALGEPDRSNAPGGFVSLGVGGHITIGFAGVINDAPGNDIRIWETSYSGDVCGQGYDEHADIELSSDGVNFVSAGSICLDGEIDMADFGLTSVTAIRITNSAATTSLDGYDVDGVEAINGCAFGTNPITELTPASQLTSFPNPTSGNSQVVFSTDQTVHALVQVYDINGRNVATLFNQVANANQEYRIDFNGNNLPDGIYIYRMITNNETIINKFMIAR